MLNDIKTLFQNFNAWQVKYVPWKANGVAHRLARLALTNGIEHTWHDNFPLSMLDVVSAEQVHDLN
jgi:outer membrane biogenesis lipoprotein LolB